MNRLVKVVAIVVCVTAALAIGGSILSGPPTSKLKPFKGQGHAVRVPQAGFSITFPAEPKHTSGAKSGIPVEMYSALVDNEMFVVSALDLGQKLGYADVVDAVNRYADAIGGQVIDLDESKRLRGPAVEYVLSLGRASRLRGAAVSNGRRLYQIHVQGTAQAHGFERFVSSFALLGDPA